MKHNDSFNWREGWICLLIIAVVYGLNLAGRVVVRYEGNLTGLFCIGDLFPVPSELGGQGFYVHPNWIGYDGQFSLFLAYDPLLRRGVAQALDKPPYRAQRIGLPVLAHVFSFGNSRAIPSVLVGLNVTIFFLGCVAFLKILEHLGASSRWVLAYGLSAGLMESIFRVLPDAAATSLMWAAVWTLFKNRWLSAAILLSAAALVREVSLVMTAPLVVWSVWRREWRQGLAFLTPFVVCGAWAIYVHAQLGAWPFSAEFGAPKESNFGWPMAGLVEKFTSALPHAVAVEKSLGMSKTMIGFDLFADVLFTLGVIFACYLTALTLVDSPRQWLPLCLGSYVALAIFLSVVPWSSFRHVARILDPLVLLPVLIHLQKGDGKFLVPLVCSVPASLCIFLF